MQIELLRELMKLQKDMIIMLLSMLEGNSLMISKFYFFLFFCYSYSGNVLNGPSKSIFLSIRKSSADFPSSW